MISNQDKTSTQAQTTPIFSAKVQRPHRAVTALGWLVLFAVCLSGLLATALADLIFNYGVSHGPALSRIQHVSPAQLGTHTVGVNTALHLEQLDSPTIDRSLEMIKAGGFGLLRQIMPWEEVEPVQGQFRWEKFDALVDKARQNGLQLLLRLDRSPPWSRSKALENLTEDQKVTDTGPPDNYQDYFNFAGQVAARYSGRVRYYQIWNEPNLEGEWNNRPVDPRRYTELLRGAYQRIKAADPAALVLSAPLAPTDGPGFNMNDLRFLDEMYRAGARDYFDIMGVQIYGLGYGPDFRYFQPDFRYNDLKRINFNRPAAIREVMVRWGDGTKPAWATEYGWVAVPPELVAAYRVKNQWGDSVSESEQARYLVEGIERIRREWPWVGVINVWLFRADPTLAGKPEQFTNYFTIVRPDFEPRPAYLALQQYNLTKSGLAYTGWHPAAANPALQPGGDRAFSFRFEGERLELVLTGPAPAGWQFRLDGRAITGEPRRVEGSRWLLAEGLAPTEHTLEVSGLNAGAVEGFYVSRDNKFALWIALALALTGLGTLISGARLVVLAGAGLGWLVPRTGPALQRLRQEGWSGRAVWIPGAMAAALALFYLAPPVPLALAGLVLFFPLCLARPDWAVGLAVLTAPLYMHPRNLSPGGRLEFTLAEVIIVELVLTWLALSGWRLQKNWRAGALPLNSALLLARLRSTGPLIPAMAALLAVGTLSLLVPESYRLKEALREYRLIIFEPVALFFLALAFMKEKGSGAVLRLVDFLVAAGAGVALVAIYQFVAPARSEGSATTATQVGCTVLTEGVKRICSVYTHPDNLGLFLGRVLPLTIALVLLYPAWPGGGWPRRRVLYGLALLPLSAALLLSFSRGAWLGVAAALLVVLAAGGLRRWLVGYGALLLAGVAALPFIRIERIASLLNFSSGSSSTRLYLWQSSLDILRDHPLTGVGLDQFLYFYNPQYVHPLAWTERFTSHPHNMLLDFWLRLGVAGPVLLAGLLLVFFGTAWRLRRAGQAQAQVQPAPAWPFRRALATGLLGSMVDFGVHGMVDNSYFVIDLAIIFCASFAMLELLRREARAEAIKL